MTKHVCVGFLLAHSAAWAASVNFDTLPDNSPVAAGTAVTNQWASQGVTFTAGTGLSVFVYADAAALSINPPLSPQASTPNVICATAVFAGTGQTCSDFTIAFSGSVSTFSIDTFGWDDSGSQITVTINHGGGQTVSTISSPQQVNDKLTFSTNFAGITSVVFSGFTDRNGNAFDNLNFDAVPEPGTWAAGAAGLLALAGIRRLRR